MAAPVILPDTSTDPHELSNADQTPTPALSLDDREEPTPTLSLDEKTPPPQITNDQATVRAAKASFGWGPTSPGLDTIRQGIIGGNEQALRTQLASEKAIQIRQLKLGMVNQLLTTKAKNNQGPITEDEQNFIMNMPDDVIAHPDSIFESQYARAYVNRMASASLAPENANVQAMAQMPDQATQEYDIASSGLSRREQALTLLENLNARAKAQGIGSKSLQFLETLVPGLSWYRTSQVVKNSRSDAILPGTDLAEKSAFMYTYGDKDFLPKLREVAEQLWQKNPLDAINFVQAVTAYGTGQEHLDNLFGVMDATMLAGAATKPFQIGAKLVGAARGIASLGPVARAASKADIAAVRQAMKDTLRGVQGAVPDPVQMFSAAGDTATAARISATQKLQKILTNRDPVGDSEGLRNAVPSLFNPTTALENPGSLSREKADRLFNGMVNTSENLVSGLGRLPMVPRMTDEARNTAFALAEDDARKQYTHLNDAILDVVRLPAEKTLTNNDMLLVNIGKRPGVEVTIPAARKAVRAETEEAATADNIFEPKEAVRPTAESEDLAAAQNVHELPGTPKPAPKVVKTAAEDEETAAAQNIHELPGEGKPVPKEPVTKAVRAEDEEAAAAQNVHELPGPDEYKTIMGKAQTAELFDDVNQAHYWAQNIYNLPDGGYRVMPNGSKYYIEVVKPVSEVKDPVRELMIPTSGYNSTPNGLANTFIGYLRSSEDTLSKFNRDQRHIATHVPQEMHRLLIENAKEIGAMSKRERSELNRLLTTNRDMPNPDIPGMRGYFHKTVGEFEQAFSRLNGHMPSDKQTAAYFKYIQLNDFDYVLRNLGLFSQKSRLGIEHHQFDIFQDGNRLTTPWMEMRKVDDLPWGNTENAGVLVIDSKTGSMEHYFTKDASAMIPKDDIVQKMKQEGYQALQVADPNSRPLEALTGVKDPIHFVVTDSYKTKPLPWKQITYNPGGHSIYRATHYVKQPIVLPGQKGFLNYFGDTTIFGSPSESHAMKFAKAMDDARQLLLQDKMTELTDFLSKNLPYNTDEFQRLFREGGHLLLDQPIVHTKADYSAMETVVGPNALKFRYGDRLRDNVRSGYNLYGQLDKKFLADKDAVLPTIREGGSEAHPLFNLEPATQLDPYSTLQRSLGQSMRDRWMNDYKASAVESWTQEFSDLFQDRPEVIRRNPLYFFNNPKYKSTADKGRLAQAKIANTNITNFIGAQTDLGSKVSWALDKTVSAVYDKLGFNAAEIADAHLLPVLKDPWVYARNLAFHLKLGLFNPIRLFLHAQFMAHSIAVAGPQNGIPGIAAAILSRMALYSENPAVVNRFADFASKFGWRADDFAEMHNAMRNNGIANVMGETAWRDDIFDPKIFKSQAGKILDAGTWFFAEGERLARMAGFATAYREWRLANPVAELTDREMGKVMTRADLLGLNMTRASMAAYQKGIASIPAQFLSFSQRFMEQFLGNRLTPAEKLRAFTTYSLLYGVPVAAGGAVGVWPVYDSIKEEALERGIDLSPAYAKFFMEGIPSTMFSAITGLDYNFASRYGMHGESLLRDALEGRKSPAELFTGASGGVLADIFHSTAPAIQAAASFFMDDGKTFPASVEDLISTTQNIESVNLGIKAFWALSAGKYISKSGQYIGDVKPIDALFMGIAGLTPMKIMNTELMIDSLKQTKAAKDKASQFALTELRHALTAMKDNNPDVAQTFLTRAKSWMVKGDLLPNEKARLFEQFMREGNANLVQRTEANWWLKAPASQQQERMKQILPDYKGAP